MKIVYQEITTKKSLQMKRGGSHRNPTLPLVKNRVSVTKNPVNVQLTMDLTPCEKAVDPTVRKRTQPLFVYTPDRCKTPGLLTRQMTPCAKLKIRLFGRTQLHIRSRLRRRPGARTQDIHYRGGEDAMIYQYLQNRIVSDRSIDEVN